MRGGYIYNKEKKLFDTLSRISDINKEDINNALKDSNIVEFNSDFTKIKKKIIIQEFLDKNRK